MTISYLLPLTLILSSLFTEGCRSRQRAAEIESSAAILKVTLRDMHASDKQQPNLRFQLTHCVKENSLFGTQDETTPEGDPIIKFNVKALTEGEQCGVDVRIDTMEAYPSEIKFTNENLVLYTGKYAVITRGLRGEFITSVNLKPNYYQIPSKTNPEGTFALKLRLTFPADLPAQARLDGFLYCTPEVKHMPSSFNAINKTSGDLTFNAVHKGENASQHSCSKITIYNGDQLAYFANMSANTYAFAAIQGQNVDLTSKPITLQKVVPPPSQVILETRPGECNPETHYFDINKRTCVPKS